MAAKRCEFCEHEYFGHDKGACVGCVNFSHFEYCPERKASMERIKRAREEAEKKSIEEAKKKDEGYPEGRHGCDLIKREQVVQLIREMMKENQESTAAGSFYGATLVAGWESCLKSVEERVKKMDSAPLTEPVWGFLRQRFENVQ